MGFLKVAFAILVLLAAFFAGFWVAYSSGIRAASLAAEAPREPGAPGRLLLKPKKPVELWDIERGLRGLEASAIVEVCGDSLILRGEGRTAQEAVEELNFRIACLGIEGRVSICEECD